jgi:enoyl-CoA hydratase
MVVSTILVRRTGRVATVTLNRPRAHNALSRALVSEVTTAVRSLDRDEGVGAIVITGSGSAFCAGLDLKELASLDPELLTSQPESAILPPAGSRGPFSSTSLPRRTPLISAINGACVTGVPSAGLEPLVPSCHATCALALYPPTLPPARSPSDAV